MPLPPPHPRRQVHTRQVVYRGFQRDDGLWDIEGELIDSKPYAFELPRGEGAWAPNEPIHHMLIRVTVDATLMIHDIAVSMEAFPHGPCPQAMPPMQQMIGCTMGAGWRQMIERHLGRIQGCAHLRELLFNLATAAYQTLVGTGPERAPDEVPHHLGRCVAWDFNGPVVEKLYPLFYQRDPRAG